MRYTQNIKLPIVEDNDLYSKEINNLAFEKIDEEIQGLADIVETLDSSENSIADVKKDINDIKEQLEQKVDKENINEQLEQKVDKENGKGLSTNDFTNLEKTEVAKVKDKLDKTSLLNLTYPIGSVYISVSNIDPGTLFGGSWVEFAKGQTLVGVDTTQTEFNTVLKTGGEKKSSELSCGNRQYGLTNSNNLGYEDKTIIRTTAVNGFNERNAEISLLQPYVTVYMWQRTK